MRLLINDHAGHPFQIQLSRNLAKRGYLVRHTFTKNLQTPRGILERRINDADTLKIVPLDLSQPFNRYAFAKRIFQEKRLGSLLVEEVDKFRPDIVLSANTPISTQSSLLKKCASNKICFVYWLQDLLGIGISNHLKKKIPILGSIFGRYFIWKEIELIRKSNGVIVVTEDFIPILKKAGVRKRNIFTVNNWSPIDELPVEKKRNSWASEKCIDDTFNFIYTGTLGLKHNPELLIKLSRKMKRYEKVNIIVTSEGLGADYLKKKKKELSLENIKIFPFQQFNKIPMIQGTADVLVAILENDAGIFSVPSKVLTYMCAKRAILLAVPEENLSARIVKNNNAGIVVSPKDYNGFVNAAEKLLRDWNLRNKMAENGRNYARNRFDIEKISDRFEKIFLKLLSQVSHPSKGGKPDNVWVNASK